jgi:hypothetical protein
MEIPTIKIRILDDIRKRAMDLYHNFSKVHQSFYAQYQEEIQKLKKALIADQPISKLPVDTWTAVNNHLDYLHEHIRMFENKYDPALDKPFLTELKLELISGLNEIPRKFSTSFNMKKFSPEENDSFSRKQLKKISLRYYHVTNKVSSKIRKKKSYLKSGRQIYLHNFLQHHYLLPASQFIFDQWNDSLKMAVLTYDLLSKTTERLKDELLVAKGLTERDIYWKKAITQKAEKIIAQYEETINNAKESNDSFYYEMSKNIQTAIDDIIKKSDDSWEIAGTSLYPNRKYSQRIINSRYRNISKRYLRLKRSWKVHLERIKDEWQKDIDLAQVQLTAACYWYETGQIIKNKFYNDIIPLFKEIKKKVIETKNSILPNVNDIEDKVQIKNKLLMQNRKLVRSIRDKDLPELLNLLDPNLFSQSFSGFIKRMFTNVDTLPENHTVLAFVDLKNLPLKIKSDKVALKDLLKEETLNSAESEIERINTNLQQVLDAASRSLATMDQVVEYNLEGALNLIRNEEDEHSWQEAIDITQQGLERVDKHIDDLILSLKTEIDNSLKKFELIAAKLVEDIQILGDNEELLKLKITLTRARTKARLIEFRKKIWSSIRLFLPKLLSLINNTIKKVHDRYSKVQRFAGIAVSDIQSEISFTQYLTDVQKKIDQMPYIYQRIFRIEPLEDNKFFIGRSDVLDIINQDFEDFKKEYHPITAVIGEKGSGKTSTLNYAKRNILKGFPLTEIDITHTIYTKNGLMEILKLVLNLPEVRSMDDMIHVLNSQKENRIIIIENVHNLFLRTIEGFQALDDLFLLISKTREKVFWIISCGRYAWEYLETVTKISSFFKRIIYLKDLSTEELKSMILDRHQISGYGINFDPPAKIAQSRQYKKLSTPLLKQQYLQDYFFKRLSEAAEGNIRVAIYFWLSSIDAFQESSINMTLDIKSESQFLYQLPTDEILSIAAFIQHEYLNEEQHALIFNQLFADSCILIERLYKKGLLIRDEDRFLIHPYLYRPIVRALKMKNII